MRRSVVFLVVLGLCFGVASAEEVWIDFGSHRAPSPTEVEIGRSDTSVLEIDFVIPGVNLEATTAEGLSFTRLAIPGTGWIGDIGTPQFPAFRRFIEIPEAANATVTANVIEWRTVDLASMGLPTKLFPAQLSMPKCDCQEARDWRFSFKDGSYRGIVGHDMATIDAPVTMRDHRMVKLTFSPIKYDADSGSLQVASRVNLRLKFDGGEDGILATHYFP